MDTETTGLFCDQHDIIALAGGLEVDGKIVENFNYKMKPLKLANITDEALEVNGFTREEIMTFPHPSEAKKDLEAKVRKYVNPFKKNKTIEDKFIPAGQNVKFDVGFLEKLWQNCGDKWYGSLFSYQGLDLLSLTQIMRLKGKLDTPNLKLATMAEHFGVEIKAHEALSDIVATRKIFYKIFNRIEIKDE